MALTMVRALWDKPWLWLALLIPLACVPLFLGLDRTDLENDEAIYSFAVETMLRDGDWLTPKSIPSETSAFLEKPPLKFWLTAIPIRLGWVPENEFGLRFMDGAMSAVALLYLFGIGRRIAGPVCGIAAVFLLFTHEPLLFHHGLRSNNMESTTFLAYAGGVYHFLAWRSINPDVKRHIYAMSFWFAFGFMTKFVAALFLPVILGAAALLRREDRGRLYRDWPVFALAAALALALIAPWFVYQYQARGPRLIDIMFGAHIVKRFTAHLDPQHLQPWHYYFTRLWTELGLGGVQLLTAVAGALFVIRTLRHRWTEGAVVVLWFVVPFSVLSTGTSKLYHYVFPFLPPFAIAGGWLIAAVARRLDAWVAGPVAWFTAKRDALLPQRLKSAGAQSALILVGLASLIVGLATMVYDRLQFRIGSTLVRNSHAIRPLVLAGLSWLVGAPGQVLRGAVVAVLLALLLPLGAYQRNVARAFVPNRQLQQLRACLTPIINERVAQGRKAPGVLVDSRNISYIPYYYLRTFGAWHQTTATDETIFEYLSAPNESRPMILSTERFRQLLTEIEGRRPEVEQAVGLVVFSGETIVLPGPYAVCGSERLVISRLRAS